MMKEDSIKELTFQARNRNYLVEQAVFFNAYARFKRDSSVPCPRYLHSGGIVANKLYVCGGSLKNQSLSSNKTYRLDLDSYEWSVLPMNAALPPRDSAVTVVHQGEMYVFGGCHSHTQALSNQLYKLNLTNHTWTPVHTTGQVPLGREHAHLFSISNQFMLLFGGCDLPQHKLYRDCYVIQKNKWTKINKVVNSPELIRAESAHCGNKIFLFGGLTPSKESQNDYNANLYQLQINQLSFAINFKTICVAPGPKPCGRILFGMTQISEDYFLVLGGECQKQNKQHLLGDAWIFNVAWAQWIPLKISGDRFPPQAGFVISRRENEIYLFGGINESNEITNNTFTLEFRDQESQSVEYCSACLQQQPQKSNIELCSTMSNTVLKQISKLITHPFYALRYLLTEINHTFQPKNISLRQELIQNNSPSINLYFDGNTLPLDNFMRLAHTNTDVNEQFQQFWTALCLCGFKISRNVLFVINRVQTLSCCLISWEKIITPTTNNAYCIWHFTYNFKTNRVYPRLGMKSRGIIQNILGRQVDLINQLHKTKKSRIVFLNPELYSTNKYNYYYQLNFNQGDITYQSHSGKAEQVQKIFPNYSTQLDHSFSRFIALDQRLVTSVKISLNFEQKMVAFNHYADLVRNLEGSDQFKPIKMPKCSFIKEAIIIGAVSNVHYSGNQGILLFHEGHFIERYQCELGRLQSTKIYKVKIRPGKQLWSYMGYVEVESCVKPYQSLSGFQKTQAYFSVIAHLKKQLKVFHRTQRTKMEKCGVQEKSLQVMEEQNLKQDKQDNNATGMLTAPSKSKIQK